MKDSRLLCFDDLRQGIFLERPNRFTVLVETDRGIERAHLHDPGRLDELLKSGARLLMLPRRGKRTSYHVIAIFREEYGWVFAHSGYHSAIAERIIEMKLLPEFRTIRGYEKEVRIDGRRLDFLLDLGSSRELMEVKGCTLFQGDLALFPDSPTERGREHVETLGERGGILMFLVFTDRARALSPNWERDENFSRALLEAFRRGIHIISFRLRFDGRCLEPSGPIPCLIDPGEEAIEILEDHERVRDEFREETGFDARISAVSREYVDVVFWSDACTSCALDPLFAHYQSMLRDAYWMVSSKRIGGAFLVRFGRI